MITPIAEDIFGQATSCDFHLPSEAGANVLALCDMTPLQVSSMLTQYRLRANVLGILRLRRLRGGCKPTGSRRTSRCLRPNHFEFVAVKSWVEWNTGLERTLRPRSACKGVNSSIPPLKSMGLTALKKEKRRKQNRMSQAAFRQRKEQELTALRNQVKELLAERQGLLDLHARTVMAIDHMKRIVLGLDCGTLVPKSDLPSILKHDSNAWEPHRQ